MSGESQSLGRTLEYYVLYEGPILNVMGGESMWGPSVHLRTVEYVPEQMLVVGQ